MLSAAKDTDGWVWVRVAVHVFGITAVMYAIGWGPTLAIGLIFGAVESMRLSGVRAATPAIVLSVVALGLGQLAIALGIAPTLVDAATRARPRGARRARRHVHDQALRTR